jgi:hypothetical protein
LKGSHGAASRRHGAGFAGEHGVLLPCRPHGEADGRRVAGAAGAVAAFPKSKNVA